MTNGTKLAPLTTAAGGARVMRTNEKAAVQTFKRCRPSSPRLANSGSTSPYSPRPVGCTRRLE